MAAIAGELSKQIKGHSEGAQGFRPWWDTVEDNIMYSFVILGMVTLPMTFFSKTPIECTPHPKLWHNATEIKGLSRFYPKVYCTETMIEPFLLYLPFTLLMVPIMLTAIEKTFVVLYKVEDKMNQFYHLLVKESLASEDVANLSKDNIKDCHEIVQAFKTSNACYTSYLYRTLLEIIGSMGLIGMFSYYNGINGLGVRFFDCTVYGHLFECLVPNSQFFMYVYVLAFCFIGIYLLCSLYNFVWIISSRVGVLSKFLDGCHRQTDSYTEHLKDIQKPIIRLKLYFKPKAEDFSLLMNLLAESQGLPDALRVLSLFEHQFSMLWEPENIRLMQKRNSHEHMVVEEEKVEDKDKVERDKMPQTLVVAWDDANIAEYFHNCFKKKYTLEYSVEISPETEAPIKSIVYYKESTWMRCEELELLSHDYLQEKTPINVPRKYSLSFDGLEAGQTYKLTFSTEVDGRTVAQTIRNFECDDV
ncbi:uncharacterized protein LOC131886098 [Tigriopus californicus]|uniref:uncharacterized protein LOC131886098 n=1 Tax=Tigriopus californicus TaxID=6832 RepID=UPI0027DA8B8C|nr:uncharacterized protein LOC131886098 [Tigriopus californicus]XP_059090318.1 uncharacterized protein LOC131886098 [Tigriopus californicus]XP_059090319.1 uncharacterized protein LOC131886098 [Tigriopus californicus]XP_059090320.1 uncharacterized protein LOC131886098 [Tigriopus californicus]XP_059090321.1 uncharacterized protein LOC131886098 [Tigriopus californicus]|eukprot:TCALIF_05209-PA protein Name:"Protein of unknown function" AED:0.00 eAED:0.00 QI:72/1/1/1/0.66/0.71/7/241/472